MCVVCVIRGSSLLLCVSSIIRSVSPTCTLRLLILLLFDKATFYALSNLSNALLCVCVCLSSLINSGDFACLVKAFVVLRQFNLLAVFCQLVFSPGLFPSFLLQGQSLVFILDLLLHSGALLTGLFFKDAPHARNSVSLRGIGLLFSAFLGLQVHLFSLLLVSPLKLVLLQHFLSLPKHCVTCQNKVVKKCGLVKINHKYFTTSKKY